MGETWQVSGWFDAWIAVRGCDGRGGRARRERSLLAPTLCLCGEKMMMPSRGRAEARWSGVPGWRDDAMR